MTLAQPCPENLLSLISGRSLAEIEKRTPSLDGLDEPAEENDGQHDQLTWFYHEYGVGSIYTRAEREEALKNGWTLCVCTEDKGTWMWDWQSRQNTHADGECSCWCENCDGYRNWYWVAGPGRRRLIHEDPAVEPETCACIADDKEYLAGDVEHPRYPVYHQANACECRCMPCRAWRQYQTRLDSERFRQVLEEERLKEIARREAILEADRKAAEHARWVASPEGKAELARQEAERQRLAAEDRERRQREFDQAEESARLDFLRLDTDPDMVRSVDDPVRDLQALVAACSGTAWRTAADPRTGEMRENWDARQNGDVECYPALGKLYMHRGQLVELRGRGCPEHRAEVEEWRRKGLLTTDYEYCLSDCPAEVYVHPLHGGQALKSYLDRQYEGVFRWTGEMLSSPSAGRPAKFAGRHWEIIEFGDADFKDAMAANDFMVAHLAGIGQLPTLRPDGTLVSCTGYDPATGFWYAPAGTPGQRSMAAGASSKRSGMTGVTTRTALTASLPHQLAEFAQRVTDWTGSFTQLKEQLGWPGTPKGLSSAIWKDELVIMALGVIIERVDRVGETRAAGIRIRHQIERSERSNAPRALPPVVLPGEIEVER